MPQITTGFILRPHARIQMAIVSYISYLPRSQIVTVLDVAYLPHSQIVTVLDTAYLSHLQIITVLDIAYLSHLQIILVLDIVYLAHLQIAIYRPGGYRKRDIQFSGLFSIFWTYSRCSICHCYKQIENHCIHRDTENTPFLIPILIHTVQIHLLF